jgi:hypothetical protein
LENGRECPGKTLSSSQEEIWERESKNGSSQAVGIHVGALHPLLRKKKNQSSKPKLKKAKTSEFPKISGFCPFPHLYLGGEHQLGWGLEGWFHLLLPAILPASPWLL